MEDLTFSNTGIKLSYNGDDEIKGLPNREIILDIENIEPENFDDEEVIQNLHFLPIDVFDNNMFRYRKQIYILSMIGILNDGKKVQINLINVPVYFDILIPIEYEDRKYAFEEKIRFLLGSTTEEVEKNNRQLRFEEKHKSKDVCEIKIREVKGYPMKGFNLTQKIYKRVYFDNLQNRKKALSIIKEHYITASDDVGNYYRMISGFSNISFTDWIEISKYTIKNCNSICKAIYDVKLENFKPIKDVPKTYKQPLIMAWDIETYSGRGNGDLPCPEFDKDNAFMICMSFYQLNSIQPLISICLVDVDTSPSDSWVTIVCGSYINILKAFALCWNAFAPDIVIGFNDSNYDWRFVIIKAFKLDIIDWMFSKMTANYRTSSTVDDIMKWNFVEKRQIKISAEETFYSSYLKLSGCISIDVRVCFKKLYPKGESSSLKYYLNKCNLLSKTDMPIKRMWDIYRNSLDGKGDPDQMRLVAHYCIVDAMRCQELMRKRNIIEDLKETGSLTFLSLADCYYCAGGLKVRQVLRKYANECNILTTTKVDSREENGKYPGAFVFTPVKGIIPDPHAIRCVDELREKNDSKSLNESLDKSLNESLKIMEGNRPVTGLDFGSLYPSIIMTHNLSPEKIITDHKYAEELKSKNITLHTINFIYNDKPVTAYSVNHENKKDNYGLYVKVLIDLAFKRSELKKDLSKYGKCKEIIELIFSKKINTLDAINLIVSDSKENINIYDEVNNGKEIKIPTGSTREIEINNMKQLAEEANYTISEINRLLNLGDLQNLKENIKKEYERVCFEWSCVNTKQNALKVVMNTFYGEAGNTLSPYFLLELAGGVTSSGQYNIKLIADFVISKKYIIKYGDTDSLYLVAPNSYFLECDREYINGNISKEEWMTAMVRITMRAINHLKNEVNDYLEQDNGTKFLKMNYEEVLFPVVFTGKKKYFGVPHTVHILFTNHLFIRGIDVIKQGQSELAKKIGYQIMHESTSIYNKYTILEIVKNALTNAIKNSSQWEFKDFIKSDAYKPNKDNKSVQRFISRMRAILSIAKKENDELIRKGLVLKPYPFTLPEPGERFNYVITTKEGEFDMNGRKIVIKKGDRMEFADIADKSQIDILFYITNYVIGICTRFISSDPTFQPPEELQVIEVDEYAQKQAKKMLENFVKQLVNVDNSILKKKGYAYRRAYNAASSKVKKLLYEQIGNGLDILHGKKINYSLFTEYDEDKNQSEVIWNNLLVASDELSKAAIVDGYFAKVCKLLNIMPNGNDKDEKTCLNLYKYDATRKSGVSKSYMNYLDNKENNLRSQLITMIPYINEIATRYEINLNKYVSYHRNEEHKLNPEFGFYHFLEKNSNENSNAIFDENDKLTLNKFNDLWNHFISIKRVKFYKIEFHIYLSMIKNKRLRYF